MVHDFAILSQVEINMAIIRLFDFEVQLRLRAPLNGIIEIAGPEQIRLNDLVHQFLAARRDSRTVAIDRGAGYYGTTVNDQSLIPGDPSATWPDAF